MGTRGLYGFYKDGITKATYNHWDSYPSNLGVKFANSILSVSTEVLNDVFSKIILVKEDDVPMAMEIKDYLGAKTGDNWYEVLRQWQGDISPYLDGRLKHMIDSHNFIEDSLFCEWAYIVNLDTNTFEVYEGFQDIQNEYPHRYSIKEPHNNNFYSCRLLLEIPLEQLEISSFEKNVNSLLS